ncbi:ermin [Oenanthe melanoleuca]|uniref:ermin n=1 Tax=Oenanthe melanoleuca TaxID=2939378 RepID=UPI0024C12394|nr:ermin [Oenanthe melanoleuca]
MAEPAPALAPNPNPVPACNGSLPPLPGGSQEIPKSLGTVPYANADTSPDTSPAKESLEETRNSLAEDIAPENFAGCQEKREESAGTLQQGAADVQDTGTNGQGPGEGPGGTAGTRTETPPGSAEPRGNAEEAEEEEVEEQDTEEDEVQVIEMKKENSEGSRPQQPDKEPSPPGSPGCNSPLEKAGEQPSLGKKNDISRHSYSRYNTISYRRIRKGNTKQRIDEFESMMHL